MGWITAVIGLVIVYYARQIADGAGYIDFAENYFGVGGTRIFVFLTGIVIFFVSLVYQTGGFGMIINALGLAGIF